MPPANEDDEVLQELDDDAIVAQQAPAHAPAPRVQITEEARTIVVEEPPVPAGETARVRAITRGRNDPTMVVRAVRYPHPYAGVPVAPLPQPAPPSAWPSWLPWLVWGIAGLIAFAIGGALAIMAARRDAAPPVQQNAAPTPAATVVRE